MKVFIKSLLIISLLSGNISYAGTNKPKNIESLTLAEQQERLEELHELVLKLEGKKKLIEEFFAKKGDVITNYDMGLGAGAIVAILAAIIGVSRYRAAIPVNRERAALVNSYIAKFNLNKLHTITDKESSAYFSRHFSVNEETQAHLLGGISVISAGAVLTDVVNGFAKLSESEFNEKLVDSTPSQNQVLYSEISKQIDKTKKEIQALEESMMESL
ncbi:MAG: hypothetical protein V4596_13770 [Bdellovibrionota bacterium]